MKLNNYNTYIFDFDGTLLDSEPYHKKAHSKTLSYILNRDIDLTDKDFERYIGKRDTEIFEMYKHDYNVEFDTEKMINKKVEAARDLLLDEKVKIFDYFFDLVKQKENKKFFIVSNQHPDILFSILKVKGIIKCFDDIFCLPKMDVKKDYFYKNIGKFIPNSKKIVVFEDDEKVLNFLSEIGYDVVAIKNEMNYHNVANKFKNIIKV